MEKISDAHYQVLFEHAPIPLVEADFSKLRAVVANSTTRLEQGISPGSNHDVIKAWAGYVEFVDANKAALSMFGVHSCRDLAPEQILAGTESAVVSFASLVDSLVSGTSNWNGYSEIAGESGKILSVSISAEIAVLENGWDVRVFFSFTDVTSPMRELVATRHAQKIVRDLTSDLRHDIVNQLIAITGYIDLSLEEASLSTIYNYIERARAAAETISRQIASTKKYQHFGESGPAWYALNDLITSKDDLPPDLARIELYADPDIKGVFLLLESAMKNSGGKTSRIRWSMESEKHELRIICEADGNGIPSENKDKIFQRIWQGPVSLFPAREIFGITGISIRESGKPGIYTRFIVTVPGDSFFIPPK